jgi:hypothetical protein
MKKRYTLIFALLFISLCFAQNKDIETTINALQKDQLLFEKVFVHTNKTKYTVDDVIWFKAYVVTNDNKPSVKTTVLYVSLFSESGKLVRTKNVLIQNGVGTGQFEVFGDVKKGTYYLQANTNYMKNFGEDNKYIQKIQIDKATVSTTNIANYDIQVFPQGGYLLENIDNTLGLKALINGKNTDYTGVIVDSENKEIASFKNQYLGMAKVKFRYLPSERYQAIFKLKDTIIKVKLPEAKITGLTINTSKSTATTLKLELQTNLKSIKQSKTNYMLLFHQRNKLIDYVAVNFIDTAAVKLEIDKAGFLNGVNTVTVFKDNLPILERKFFVYKGKIKQELTLETLASRNDSTTYKIKLEGNKIKGNMSVSVLPESASYAQTTTTESAFLLTPYINGYIENPAYYFNADNANRFSHLDLLLLTQGWTQYTAADYIVAQNPKSKYNFEQGYTLSGTVTPLKSNNLGLLSKNNQVVAETFLNSTPEFEFKNLLVYKGDSIKVSFLIGADRNIAEKPRNISFDTLVDIKRNLIYNFEKDYVKFEKEYAEEQKVGALNLKDLNQLDEVSLKGKRKSKEAVLEKAFIDKYRRLVFNLGEYYKLDIPEKYIKNNMDIGAYLREYKGLKIISTPIGEQLTNGIVIDDFGRVRLTAVILDGVDLRKPGVTVLSLSQVFKIRMDEIDRLVFRPKTSSKSYDRIGIFTTDNYKKGVKELFKHYVFKNGYDTSKKYYNATYDYAFENESTAIDWKPNLVTDASGEVTFKIKEDDISNEHLFIVQGFTKQGQLISSIITRNGTVY